MDLIAEALVVVVVALLAGAVTCHAAVVLRAGGRWRLRL
jgi:hypothetical protein